MSKMQEVSAPSQYRFPNLQLKDATWVWNARDGRLGSTSIRIRWKCVGSITLGIQNPQLERERTRGINRGGKMAPHGIRKTGPNGSTSQKKNKRIAKKEKGLKGKARKARKGTVKGKDRRGPEKGTKIERRMKTTRPIPKETMMTDRPRKWWASKSSSRY